MNGCSRNFRDMHNAKNSSGFTEILKVSMGYPDILLCQSENSLDLQRCSLYAKQLNPVMLLVAISCSFSMISISRHYLTVKPGHNLIIVGEDIWRKSSNVLCMQASMHFALATEVSTCARGLSVFRTMRLRSFVAMAWGSTT